MLNDDSGGSGLWLVGVVVLVLVLVPELPGASVLPHPTRGLPRPRHARSALRWI